jgi:hypothetical protein
MMNVENFWKQLKHDHLHHVTHPRLDHLVYILIHTVTPAYLARINILNDTYRIGRSRSLTTYQKYFKQSWKTLLNASTSGKVYDTCVRDWTCNCGRQKYDRHHLCKHLVQAVGKPSIRFWYEIYRRRVIPLYRHRELVPKEDGSPESVADDDLSDHDGTITEGDDHLWQGGKEALTGSGDWQERFSESSMAKVLGKYLSPYWIRGLLAIILNASPRKAAYPRR